MPATAWPQWPPSPNRSRAKRSTKSRSNTSRCRPVFDPVEAMQDGCAAKCIRRRATSTRPRSSRRATSKRASASRTIFSRTRYRTQMVEHVPLEPHAAIAAWDANGRLTIHSTLGRITLGRADMARTLRLPVSRIRMVGTIVGGNFGGKNEITQEPALALLSKKTGRPVKGMYTRDEEFIATTTRHPIIMDYKTGVSKGAASWRARCAWCSTAAPTARGVKPRWARPAYCRRGLTKSTTSCRGLRGLYQQDHDRRDARLRRATGLFRLRIADGRDRRRARHRSAGNPVAQCLRRRLVSPTGQVLHSVVVKESLLQAAERYGWTEARS